MNAPGPSEVAITIREIGPDDDDLGVVSRMHMELLDFGPMAGLGETFVRKACYAMHMRGGSLRCALCEVDGEPAGFVAYTDRSIGFHRDGLSRHWVQAGLALIESLIREPQRLSGLVRALRVVASRRKESTDRSDPLGEIVCIAVRPEYLRRDFVRRHRAQIGERLIDYVGERLSASGIGRMRALVDADNRPALMMYHRLGADFGDYEQAGEPMVEVWLETSSQT